MKLLLDTCCVIWAISEPSVISDTDKALLTEPDSFHTDPTDRIIVATARLYDAKVVAKDQEILGHPHVKSRW